jgi:hypothetical protein
MLSKADLQKLLRECTQRHDLRKPEGLSAALMEIQAFTSKNCNDLDEEVKAVINNAFDTLEKHFREVIPTLPDSKEKRALQKKLRSNEKKYPTAGMLIQGLASPPRIQNDILKDTALIFESGLQAIIDLMWEALENKQSGPEGFAKTTLLMSTTSELTIAHHLGQRGYMNQAYAHIRTIFELCDKAELFHNSSEWAKKWVEDGSSHKIQHELRPAGVRQKLGKPKHDPIYGYLSSLGTHATFDGVRLFTAKPLEKSEGKNPIHVWLGGCLREDQVILVHMFLLMAVLVTLNTIYKVFAKHLHEEDAIDTLLEFAGKLQGFIDKRLVTWSKAQGADMAEFEAMLSRQAKILSEIASLKPLPEPLPKTSHRGEAD